MSLAEMKIRTQIEKLKPQIFPRFLVADFHGHRAFAFSGGEDGEKIEFVFAHVERGMHHSGGNVKGISGAENFFLFLHPLFGGSGKDVKNLLHLRMKMKFMRGARIE